MILITEPAFSLPAVVRILRRFAIDWKRTKQGEIPGDARDVRSYYSYGEKVFAVADAVVVSAKDGLPDNVPRTAAGFDTAVPLTMENVAGNAIVLDFGDGQFAYAHCSQAARRRAITSNAGVVGPDRWFRRRPLATSSFPSHSRPGHSCQ